MEVGCLASLGSLEKSQPLLPRATSFQANRDVFLVSVRMGLDLLLEAL